jgi:hypothetical protein
VSLSPDRVVVRHTDRLTARVAARFLLLDLKLQAKETEFMAALQSVIAVVHLMAYGAFLHEFRGHEDLHAGEIPCLKVDWPHQSL